MQVVAYHLEARSPFHLGVRGVGIEETGVYATADTLFSALCHTIRQTGGNATLLDWLDSYAHGEPAMVLSSAYPWRPALDGTAFRLWPRPLAEPPGLRVAPEERKSVKGVAWLSGRIWSDWLAGKALKDHWPSAVGSRPDTAGELLQSGRVWVSAADRTSLHGDQFWSTGDAPRVTVDRVTNASEVYQAGRVQYAEGGGLWFAVLWGSNRWREMGEAALHVLGDAGLGGERSSGHGQFRVAAQEDLDLPYAGAGHRCVLLSPFYPADQQELTAALAGQPAYQLQVRRGWMSSPDGCMMADGTGKQTPVSGSALRRKSVRLFAEGSLLAATSEAGYMGALADAAPAAFAAHAVYRYGIALLAGYGTGMGEVSHD